MEINKIAAYIGIETKFPEAEINWLLTDSRTLSFPAESLFFAIKTKRNDGHRYVSELYRQNLRYFVVSEMLPEYSELNNAIFFTC